MLWNLIILRDILDRKWEDIDHDLEDSVAGALISPTGGGDGEGDPLGLGAVIEWVSRSLRYFTSDASSQCKEHGLGI
jgi:hypothetical protein